MDIKQYTNDAVELLMELIKTPSVSHEETQAADILCDFIGKWGMPFQRIGNNVLIQEDLNPEKPTLLLNAHIDTVKPVATWTRDPFTPVVEGDRLYGLGANDCGGGLVSLLQVYRILRDKTSQNGTYNVVLDSSRDDFGGGGGIAVDEDDDLTFGEQSAAAGPVF